MKNVTTPTIDPEELIDFMNVDETDFSSLTSQQRIRHLEVEGYVVLPGILDFKLIAKLKSELADFPMTHKSYSAHPGPYGKGIAGLELYNLNGIAMKLPS